MESAKRIDAVIVGAGISGLDVGARLQTAGLRVKIVEARDRIGGRIHTVDLQRLGLLEPAKCVAELGAEMIHGRSVTTWELIRRFGLQAFDAPNQHSFVSQGSLHAWGSPLAEKIENFIERLAAHFGSDRLVRELIQEVSGPRDDPQVIALVSRMLFSLEGASDQLSARGLEWKEQENANFLPENFRLDRGYGSLIKSLSSNLEVSLNSVVRRIECGDAGCRVLLESGALLQSRLVVVSVPLGVLKSGQITFSPELPQSKQQAIEKIGSGKLAKYLLVFDRLCWSQELEFIETFGPFGSWWGHGAEPFLSCLIGERGLSVLGPQSESERMETALRELKPIFDRNAKAHVKFAHFTDWTQDPYSLGGYSFNPVGLGDARRELASSIGQTLYFCGEATCFDGDHATVHGALDSAKRCAAEILAVAGAPRFGAL